MTARDRVRGRWWLGGLSLVVLLVSCTGGEDTGGSGFPPDPPEPPQTDSTSTSALSELLSLGETHLDALQAGDEAPPSLIDWDSVEQGTTLPLPQVSAFCKALDAPGVDSALASLLSAGFDALWMRLRHRPPPDEVDAILDIGATFAAKTCPAWQPGPAPTPMPQWYPAGYASNILHRDLAWQFVPPELVACTGAQAACWKLNVTTRAPCTGVSAWLTTASDTGTALELLLAFRPGIEPGIITTLEFGTSDARAVSASISAINCFYD